MSYINAGREQGLPAINSARRVRELEMELSAYRQQAARSITPTHGGSTTRRAVNEVSHLICKPCTNTAYVLFSTSCSFYGN